MEEFKQSEEPDLEIHVQNQGPKSKIPSIFNIWSLQKWCESLTKEGPRYQKYLFKTV